MAAEGSRTGGGPAPAGRSIAQWFCLIVGAVLVLVGLLGFLVNSEFNTGDAVAGDTLIVFEVNGWHNVVHILTGAFLLAMSPKHKTARTGALAFAAAYAVVTIYGLVDGDDVLTLVPINAADNVLHIVLTLAALAAGLAPAPHAHGAVGPGRGAATR
jgi:hypothetical protein